jgi:hypothetical protein
MQTMRHITVWAAALLLVAQIGAQTKTPAPTGSNAADANRWSFSLTAYGYLVPDDTSYGSPIFTADRQWLHLEARYNYENQQTGSLWAGYNLRFGDKLVLEITPMLGAVFGRTTGIAPGCNVDLSYKRVELSSQCEYVFDTESKSGNFFYSWSELSYAPIDWLRAGLVAQRTRAYQTPLDVQRGFLVGVSHKRLDFTTYVLNPGWTTPTIVLVIGFKF